MKTFFFMGPNPKNVSRVSWKIWKIERKGRKVTLLWGPAVLKRRRVKPANTLQSKVLQFSSIEEARQYETARIKAKTGKGYKRSPRRRSR